MTEFKLNVLAKTVKPHLIRKEGKIPAIVYGKNFEPIAIAIEALDFQHIFRAAGTSHLIDMNVGDNRFKTLVKDIQLDPVSGKVIHVDFMKINMKEKITAEVPLVFINESPAVVTQEGSLINPVDSIEIECLPADLPAEITVDLAVLDDFEKNIKVSDLNIPSGVEVLSDPEEIIAFVQEPRSEEEMAELETEIVEDVEAIEVENAGEAAPAEGEEGAAPAPEKEDEKKSE